MFYTELNLTRKVSETEEWFRTTSYFSKRMLLRFIFSSQEASGESCFQHTLPAHSSSLSHSQHFSLRSNKPLVAKPLPNPCDCSVWGWGSGSRSPPHCWGWGFPHLQGFHSPFNFKQVSLPVSNLTLPTTTDALWLEGKLSVCLIAQSCLTLCNPVDYSPPGSSVHGDSPGKNPSIKKAQSLRLFRMTGAIWNRSFPPQVYGSWANRELAS